MRSMILGLATMSFILALAFSEYVRYKRRSITEGFDAISDMIQKIQQAQGQLGTQQSFDNWAGWLYKIGKTKEASRMLNDLKKRAFQPDCKFREDWLTNPGNQIPIAPETKDLANLAYKSYLDCLAKGDQGCINQLADARNRFMEPECGFQLQADKSVYNQNYQTVF